LLKHAKNLREKTRRKILFLNQVLKEEKTGSKFSSSHVKNGGKYFRSLAHPPTILG